MLRASFLLGYVCFLIIWAVIVAVPGGGSEAPASYPAYMGRWYIGEVLLCFVLLSALVAATSVVVADNSRTRRLSKIVDWLLIGTSVCMLYVLVDIA